MKKHTTKRVISALLITASLLGQVTGCAKDDRENELSNYQCMDDDGMGGLLYNKNLFYTNSVQQGAADPQVLDDTARSGYYYLYVTASVWRSKDLVNWMEVNSLLLDSKNDEEQKTLSDATWAPEVVYDEEMGKYIMFISSTAKTDTTYTSGKGVVDGGGYAMMHVALSDTPEGPFQIVNFADADSCGEENLHQYNTQRGIELTQEQVDSNEYAWVKEGDKYYQAAFPQYFAKYLLFNPEQMYIFLQEYGDLTRSSRNGVYAQDTIDPHPFVDPKTGEKYLYFTSNSLHVMIVVRMENWLKPDFSTAKIVMAHDYYTIEDWQNGKNKGVPYETGAINEGPHVLYHEDANGKGLYYLTYSMNDYSTSSYQVGIAVAENVLGPYRKLREEEGALVLCSSSTESNTISGAGHHSFLTVGDQNFIIYHRHNDATNAGSGRYTAVDEYKWITIQDIYGNDMDIPYTNGPTDSLQPLPEKHSDYRNLADEATVSVSDDEVNADLVVDGLLTIHKTADMTFMNYIQEAMITQKTTFSFKFDQPETVRSVMVYNSCNEEFVFTNVDLIELVCEDGTVKTIHDVKFDTDRYCTYGGYENDELMYVATGVAAIAEFYDTRVTEVRVTLSVPEGQEAVGISEIRILGKDGEPTYVGEGDYTFTNPDSSDAVDMDEGVTLDGEFNEKQWSEARWLKVRDKQTDTQYADIEFTTWYGEKGVYFGMKVVETGASIFHNSTRASYLNSCIEMYMATPDAPNNSKTIFEFDFACTGESNPKLNLNDWRVFIREESIMPVCASKLLGGAINTPECNGYQLEAFIPFDYLEAAGYDVSDPENFELSINPVHIWSFDYDGTDLDKDRLWSDYWSFQYVGGSTWMTPSKWIPFGANGLKAYEYKLTVDGNVEIEASCDSNKLDAIMHGTDATFTLNIYNHDSSVIESVKVNGVELKENEIFWNGSIGVFTLYGVEDDVEIEIVTKT